MKHLKLSFDRALARGTKWQLLIIGGIIVVSMLLSYILLALSGDWEQFCMDHNINKFMLPLYLIIDQNLFNEVYLGSYDAAQQAVVSYSKGLAVASGITFLIGVIFFNGAIIAILSDFIQRRVENYHNGATHYLKSGHHVIMGYDDMVPSIIRHILDEHPHDDILILSSAPAALIQEKLRESVARKSLENIVINYGHRISSEYYQDIHLEAAKQIFITGDRRKPQHDAVNVECVESICTYLKAHPAHSIERITCVFEDLDTFASFRTTDIFTDITNELGVEFVPYNFYTGWAQRVFTQRSYISTNDQRPLPYPYLFKQGIGPEDEHYVHLVFVGMSNFAVTFANEAAHLFHFPNHKQRHTLITFIDLKADKEMPVFVTRNHHYFEIQEYSYVDYTDSGEKGIKQTIPPSVFKGEDANFLDVDFEFIKGDVFASDIRHLLDEWAKDEQQYLSVFLAMANQRDNFALAMNMPDAVYNNEIPVFVRQDSSDSFITRLQQEDTKAPKKGYPEYRAYEDGKLTRKEVHGRYAHVFPFGMNESSFFSSPAAFKRAKLINYLYKTADYQTNHFVPLADLAVLDPKTIEADADKYWEALPVALKWSNLYFAYGIEHKLLTLRTIRHLEIDDPSHDLEPLGKEECEMIGHIEHNRWNVEKLLMGYRKPKEAEDKYGKDEAIAKELKNNKNLFIHHDIRPYEQLEPNTRQFDLDLAQYIPWIIAFQ